MRTVLLSLLLVGWLLCLMSCATTQKVDLPQEELLKLFQIKEAAQTDGRLVKRKVEENPSLVTKKEVVAFEAEYSKLSGSYNGTIEFLRTAVGSGSHPAGYSDMLKRDVATMQTQAANLRSLKVSITKNRSPIFLEVANAATSQLAELVITLINTSKRIEQEELARQRENVKSQLLQQRMREYGDL